MKLHFTLYKKKKQQVQLRRAITYSSSTPNDCTITRTAVTKLSIKAFSPIMEQKNFCLDVIFLYLVLKWTTNQVVLGIGLASIKLQLQGLYLSSTVI